MWFPTRIPPPSLDDANAEGDIFLEGYRSEEPFPSVFEGVPGTDALDCVDTSGANANRIRSGDFMLDLSEWSAPRYELVVFPRMIYDHGLMLRATRLDGSDEPATQLHDSDENPAVGPTGASYFTATLILPEPGDWLVVATAGAQWGCFVVDAPEPLPAQAPAQTVAEAETRGTRYSSEPSPDYVAPAFLFDRGPDVRHPDAPWNMRGSEDRACLNLTGAHDARSGEWIMRPAWAPFTAGNPRSPGTKMLFIPLHQPITMATADAWSGTARQQLRVTATLLNAPQHTYVYERDRWNARTGGEERGTLEFQHVSGMVMPRDEGDWLVVVTDGITGNQWGCFVAANDLRSAYP